MQALCEQTIRRARDLLDHGFLPEGAEKLATLRHCSCKGGCDRWRHCLDIVESQWRLGAKGHAPRRETPR